MKPNIPHHWTVSLFCIAGPDQKNLRHSTTVFVGGIDDVLGYADEQESEVNFEVEQFVITRGPAA